MPGDTGPVGSGAPLDKMLKGEAIFELRFYPKTNWRNAVNSVINVRVWYADSDRIQIAPESSWTIERSWRSFFAANP
jgi:hypothetical protein